LLHDNARLDVEHEFQEAREENDALKDKDVNSIVMAHNNIRITVDPPIKLPSYPDTWMPPPKIDKGDPMFDHIDNPGNWQDYTYTAKFEKKEGTYIIVSPQEPRRRPSIAMMTAKWMGGSSSKRDGKVKCLWSNTS
jgi:hypothetical protein